MNHPTSRLLLATLTLWLLGLRLSAGPAAPGPFDFRQPDGTHIQLHVRGDERFHWYEALDGRPVTLDGVSGFWVYAVPDANGATLASRLRVGLDQPTTPAWRPQPAAPPARLPELKQGPVTRRTVRPTDTAFVPVLFGNFTDTKPTYTANTISNILFATGPGVRSMSTYYQEVSYGHFAVQTGPSGVQDWVTVPNPAAYYATNTAPKSQNMGPRAAQFVIDVVNAAIAAGYNFVPYDQDGDGKVDVVNVIHAGRGEDNGGGPNSIWSHRSSLSAQGLSPIAAPGGVYIDDYVIEPELDSSNGPVQIGVFCHEYGHALGLPDLYDTTYASEGVGVWSLMAFGTWNGVTKPGDCPAHLDAWCKAKLGWVAPVDYTLDYPNVSFPAAEFTPFAAKLWKDGLATRQYYLVENRYPTGFDAALPGGGLFIWHVDETKSGNTQTWYPVANAGTLTHTNSGNFLVALVQADNLWQLNSTNTNASLPASALQNQGDTGDPFPGSANNRIFGPNTSPNSWAYNIGSTPGYNSFVTVSNISDPGPIMTADLYTRSPNSGPLVDWVNIAGVVPPLSGASFSRLDAQHPVVIRAFPGVHASALSQVQLYLNRGLDGRWWNFGTQQWETNATSSNYNVPGPDQYGLTLAFESGLPSGTNLVNGNLTFIVRVIDGVGIVTEIQMNMTAAHAPEVNLDLTDNAVVNTLTNFNTVAIENSGIGIQRVEVALYWDGDLSEGGLATRWYWSGTAWSTTPLWLGTDFPSHPPQATLSYPIGPDAKNLLTEKQYVVVARALDALGNAATNQVSVFYDPGTPATIYWRYSASGNWLNAANWTPSRVPAAGDDVVVNAPGDYSVTLAGNATVHSLRFGRVVGLDRQHLVIANGGSLSIQGSDTNRIYENATLDLSGPLGANLLQFSAGAVWNWTNGMVNGSYVLGPAAVLNILGGDDHDLPTTSLRNAGTVVWLGGRIRGGGNGTTINNVGLWDVQSDTDLNSDYCCGGVTFNNAGIFRKSGGSGTTSIQGGVTFITTGIVEVRTNIVSFNNGGWFEDGARFIGAGTALMNGGAFTLAGTVTSSNLVQVGGTLGGTNMLAGLFTWNAGDWNSPGLTTVAPGAKLLIQTGADHDLPSHTLTNLGTVQWTGGRVRGGGNGTVIWNQGLWDAQLSSVVNSDYCCGGTVFNNVGTLRNAVAATTITFISGVVFNNTGTVNAQGGNFTFNGGGGNSGAFNTSAGGTIALNSNFTLNPGTVFAGVGGTLTAGTLTGTWAGPLYWISGQLGGTVVIPANGTLNIVGNNDHDMPGCTLTNSGQVVWTGGRVRGGGSGTQIWNLNLWDAQTDQVINSDFCCGGLTFYNQALFRKSGGTNQTVIQGALFVNNGTVDVETNTVAFFSGVFQDGCRFIGPGTNLMAGGTFTLSGTVVSSNLVQVGGTVTGTNALAGVFTWNSGDWNSSGLTTVAPGAVLRIASVADHDLPNHTLTNRGTVLWTAGRIRGGGNGTTIVNLGLWDDQTSYDLNSDFCCGGVFFANQGTFRKSVDASNTAIQPGAVFQNSGTVEVRAGSLVLNGGGVNSGTFNTVGTGAIQINSGYVQAAGAQLSGAGNVLTSGALSGTWAGDLTWLGGTLGPAVTVPTNGVLIIAGPNDHDLPNATLTNYGTVTWTGGRVRGGANGTAIWNFGLWDAQGDLELNSDFCCGGVALNNVGVFRKSSGTNTTTVRPGVGFMNLGTVDVQVGTIQLNGGGSSTGAFQTATGATLDFNANYTLNAGTVMTGSGAVLTAGALDGTWAGDLTWLGGTLGPAVTVPTNGVLIIAGGNDHDLPNATLTNNGTVIWTGGRVRGGANGTAIWNFGLWDAQCDFDLNSDFCCGGVTVNNAGIFRKSGGAANTTLQPGVTFLNTGTLDAQSGVILLNGGRDLTGGTLHFGLGGVTNFGQIHLTGNANLTGTLSADPKGGYLLTPGEVYHVLTYDLLVGTFTSFNLSAGWDWTTNYGATEFTLTVGQSHGGQPAVVMLSTPVVASSQLQLDFTLMSGVAGSFTLLHSPQVTGPYVKDTAAVLTTIQSGKSYRFTTVTAGAAQFYRVQSQ